MDSEQNQKPESLVPSQRGALASTAASALVKRGLQDLSFTSPRWTRQHVVDEVRMVLGVSPSGLVATRWESGSDEIFSIAICNSETGRRSVIEAPCLAAQLDPTTRELFAMLTNFAWSSFGRYLVARACEPSMALRLYDAKDSEFLGVIGEPDDISAAWSAKGKYLATRGDTLKIWHIESSQEGPLKLIKAAELDLEKWLSDTARTFTNDAGVEAGRAFEGFIHFVFKPDDTLIAVTTQDRLIGPEKIYIRYLVGFDVPTLKERFRIRAPGHVESLSWAVSSQLIACCSGGNTCIIEPERGRLSALPIQAAACCCHPIHDICAFASHLATSSDKTYHVRVVRLGDLVTVTEQLLPGYAHDMCWSADGTKLYVVTSEGDLWTCSFPEIP